MAIGAICSITGLYRALFTADMRPGDTLIWEYALNDANHVKKHGLAKEFLLKYLEILLDVCNQRQVKFTAMIFVSRPEERSGKETPYKLGLKELLEQRGVSYCDVSHEYRIISEMDILPWNFYEESAHYATDHDICRFIERRALELIEMAPVPNYEARRFSNPESGVSFLDPETVGPTSVSEGSDLQVGWSEDGAAFSGSFNTKTLNADQLAGHEGWLAGLAGLVVEVQGGIGARVSDT